MKPWSLSPRGTFERLADPGSFQPFVVITKRGLHARVPTADRIQLPPDSDAGYVRIYLDPWGEMIRFDEIERIEFDARLARKPIGFAWRLRLLRWGGALVGFVWGVAAGVWIASHMAGHAAK